MQTVDQLRQGDDYGTVSVVAVGIPSTQHTGDTPSGDWTTSTTLVNIPIREVNFPKSAFITQANYSTPLNARNNQSMFHLS